MKVKSYNDYKDFVEYETKSNKSLKGFFFQEPTDKYVKVLRKLEWHFNSTGVIHKLFFVIAYLKYRRLSLKTGISIPKNVCDKGLFIPHYGSIVVSSEARIGRNCMIQNNVNIGANGGEYNAPIIGNNVYIGPGAVLYGDIQIADNCYIGANAVVNKSFNESNCVIAGVPAKVIKREDKVWWEKNRLKLCK